MASVTGSIYHGVCGPYISMGTGFTSGILSEVSADLGLNDLSIYTFSWEEVLIVAWPWFISVTTRVYHGTDACRHFIKFALIRNSPGFSSRTNRSIGSWTSIIHIHVLVSVLFTFPSNWYGSDGSRILAEGCPLVRGSLFTS